MAAGRLKIYENSEWHYTSFGSATPTVTTPSGSFITSVVRSDFALP